MKLPNPNSHTSFGTYAFALVCFLVGYATVTVLSLGRIAYDDRDGPGFNPLTRMPDGRRGISEHALGWIGFVVIALGLAMLIGLAYLWRQTQLG